MNARLLASICIVFSVPLMAQQSNAPAIDADDIGGVVTSTQGPEAGVWVIAETTDLPTKFRKIVVTDGNGRFVLPDLPAAGYKIWVRGYGLVDSRAIRARPGRLVNLKATVAPTPQAAAQYFPSNYWISMIKVPPEEDFPGTGDAGNGIGVDMRTRWDWLNQFKTECNICHQLGSKALREIPAAFKNLGSSKLAWAHRIQVGQDGLRMIQSADRMGSQRLNSILTDWGDRIAAGEVPPTPPRPKGLERNVVVSSWEWGVPGSFIHDTLASDKRTPTSNANGVVYGIDPGTDRLVMLDPKTNTATDIHVPTADDDVVAAKLPMPAPSPYWGRELYWINPAYPNHMAMDRGGRLWITSRTRNTDKQPAFCKDHPSARLAPMIQSDRQIAIYDPKTRQFTHVDTCFNTHHVQFATDADETLYTNGIRTEALGWINTRVYRETGDAAKAQGWCTAFFDLDGNGKVEPRVDRAVPMSGIYSIAVNNQDGTVWGAVPRPSGGRTGNMAPPGRIVRIDPKTCIGEAYEPPFMNRRASNTGFTPRGIDIDSEGVIWTGLAGSGQLASFDRRKCKVLTGEAATRGQHCAEGWTIHRAPGPGFEGVPDDISAEVYYYNFVDQQNTLGLGANIPLGTGSASDSLQAVLPDGQWVVMRVPYPMNFFPRGMDGRIDDPNAGWKGRGIYSNYGQNAVWHIEPAARERLGSLVKFQVRPDPLAK